MPRKNSKLQNARIGFKKLLLSPSNLVLFVLLATLFAFWYTTIDIPYWWDSAGYVISRAHFLFQTSLWPPGLGKQELGLAHSPFFIVALAAAWKTFGETLLVSHIFNLLFGIIIITYTYKLGSQLSEKYSGFLIGFCTALLLLFTPIFYSQLGIIYFEIPAMAFGLMAIYYYLRKNPLLYFISGALMVLSKETSIIFLASFIAVEWVKYYQEFGLSFKKSSVMALIKKSLFLASPALFIAGWFLYHYTQTGWFYIEPGKVRGVPLSDILNQTSSVFTFIFLSQYRFLVSLGAIVLFVLLKRRKQIDFSAEGPILIISLVIALAFSLSEFLTRYVLITLPLLYLIFFLLLSKVLKNNPLKNNLIIFLSITAVLCFIFQTAWNPKTVISSWHLPPMEEDLQYKDIISVSKQITNYLEKQHPDFKIAATFPTTYMLADPYQGYVTKGLNIIDCKDYQKGDNVDALVFHFFSPDQVKCINIIQEKNFKKALKFEKNGKSMILYYQPATESAAMNDSR